MRNLLLSWYFLSSVLLSINLVPASSQCLDNQRSLLLEMNNTLIFDTSLSTKLVKWDQSMDCCSWEGVICNEEGHVTGLDLSNELISGGINSSSSLFELQYLQSLDLSWNNFSYGWEEDIGLEGEILTALNGVAVSLVIGLGGNLIGDGTTEEGSCLSFQKLHIMTKTTDKGKKSGKRGGTRLLGLFNRRKDEPKRQLKWNSHHQPIGPNAVTFARLCGIILRTPGKCPWTAGEWKNVDVVAPGFKDWIWESLQDKFELEDCHKNWVIGDYMAAKYRHTKAYWKNKHYNKYSTDVERMKHKPDDCDENDWKKLMRYWASPDVQKIAIRNSVNRCRQVIKHTGGSRSFANIEYDMEVDMGITPTRGDLFIKTHTRADNSPSEPSSETIINEMKKLQMGEALQVGESTMSNSISDVVYYKLFPKECHGHVRGCGPGVKKKDIGICSSTGQVQGGTGAEIESLNLHIEKFKLRDMERDVEMDVMKRSLLEKDAKLEKMEKQMQMFMCLLGDAPSSYVQLLTSFGEVPSNEIMPSNNLNNQISNTNDIPSNNKSDYSKLPGKRCKILDFLDSGVVVAEGSCESSNSETLVHGVQLGHGATKVWIGEVRQHNYKLWRPTFDIVEIGEAQNTCVAWPTKYIVMD